MAATLVLASLAGCGSGLEPLPQSAEEAAPAAPSANLQGASQSSQSGSSGSFGSLPGAIAQPSLPAPPGSDPRPQPPGNLAASATSHTQTGLRWSDTSDSETGVLIERALAAQGPFMQVPDANRPATSPNETKYFDSGLTPETTYHYRVRYQFVEGASEYSATVSATTQAAPVLTAPSHLTATALGASEISLAWVDTIAGETAILIERSTSATGRFLQIHSADANAIRYTDSSRDASTTYYYRLRYKFANGYSVYSSMVSATTAAVPVAPVAPAELTAVPRSASEITVGWMDTSVVETAVLIERAAAAAGPFVQIHSAAADSVKHTDSGLAAATTYYYRIRYSTPQGPSAYTAIASAATHAAAPAPTLPAAPSELIATASTTSLKIGLRWRDNSTDETRFTIERQTGGGAWSVLASPVTGSLSRDSNPAYVLYTDTSGLVAGTNYCYRVMAASSAGSSNASTFACATTAAAAAAPAAPSDLTATVVNGPKISLRWRDNSHNESQFVIERQAAGGAFSTLASPSTNDLIRDIDPAFVFYTDASTLSAGTNYCYRVKAANSAGNSPASASACATTPAAVTTATLKFTNKTAYPLVSLFVNNTERLPGQTVLARDATIEVSVPAGSYNWAALNGYISSGQKFGMYRFPAATGSVNTGSAAAGQAVTININNYSLGQILTRLTNQQHIYWVNQQVGGFGNVWQAKYKPDGTYKYCSQDSESPQNPEGVTDAGTVSIITYNGDGTIRFRMQSNAYNSEAVFYEFPDEDRVCYILLAGMTFSDR